MTDEQSKDRIQKLKQSLYERGRVQEPSKREELGEREHGLPTAWERTKETAQKYGKHLPEKEKMPKTFLILAIGFFVIAVAIAAFVFFRGANVVSTRNVDIAVTGPVAVDGGEVLELEIEVVNRNTTALQTADLLLEFPSGTRTPGDITKELPRHRESLGNIQPGDRVEKKVSAMVFGEEGEKKEVIVSVEYRVAESNAIFVKDKLFTFEIRSAPLNVLLNVPEEVNAGQDLEFSIDVISNSKDVVENLLLDAEYPFGFDFDSSTPDPAAGEDIWDIGDLRPGERRTITIRGSIEAQDEEERTFRFAVGLADEDDPREIGTAFLSVSKSVVIKRPFIDVNLALNGSRAQEITVSSESQVRADITWANNLPVQIADVVIEARVVGSALDRTSISVDKGFYNSAANIIRWDRETFPDFGLLDAEDNGNVGFTFRSIDLSSSASDPTVTISITVEGRRLGGSGTAGNIFQALTERVVKVATDFSVSSRAVHYVGSFTNTGPMPPSAEEETTYTIIWSVVNSANDVANAQVTATLPSYVSWAGNVNPSGEQVTYNPIGGQVIWNLGDVDRGIGFGTPAREVAFQVGLIPSLSQVGTNPTIVGEATLSGTDTFTLSSVGDSAGSLNTRLSTDPNFNEGESRVVGN